MASASTHEDPCGRTWVLLHVRVPADDFPVRIQPYLATRFSTWQFREAGNANWEAPRAVPLLGRDEDRSLWSRSEVQFATRRVDAERCVAVLEETTTTTLTTPRGTDTETVRFIHVRFVRPQALSMSSWYRLVGVDRVQAEAVFDGRGGVEFRSRSGDIGALELPTGLRSAIDPSIAR